MLNSYEVWEAALGGERASLKGTEQRRLRARGQEHWVEGGKGGTWHLKGKRKELGRREENKGWCSHTAWFTEMVAQTWAGSGESVSCNQPYLATSLTEGAEVAEQILSYLYWCNSIIISYKATHFISILSRKTKQTPYCVGKGLLKHMENPTTSSFSFYSTALFKSSRWASWLNTHF